MPSKVPQKQNVYYSSSNNSSASSWATTTHGFQDQSSPRQQQQRDKKPSTLKSIFRKLKPDFKTGSSNNNPPEPPSIRTIILQGSSNSSLDSFGSGLPGVAAGSYIPPEIPHVEEVPAVKLKQKKSLFKSMSNGVSGATKGGRWARLLRTVSPSDPSTNSKTPATTTFQVEGTEASRGPPLTNMISSEVTRSAKEHSKPMRRPPPPPVMQIDQTTCRRIDPVQAKFTVPRLESEGKRKSFGLRKKDRKWRDDEHEDAKAKRDASRESIIERTLDFQRLSPEEEAAVRAKERLFHEDGITDHDDDDVPPGRTSVFLRRLLDREESDNPSRVDNELQADRVGMTSGSGDDPFLLTQPPSQPLPRTQYPILPPVQPPAQSQVQPQTQISQPQPRSTARPRPPARPPVAKQSHPDKLPREDSISHVSNVRKIWEDRAQTQNVDQTSDRRTQYVSRYYQDYSNETHVASASGIPHRDGSREWDKYEMRRRPQT
ncbi:hypothetical protein B0O80DRAFT_425826 [Mortierella sp. GBAus27b]|nr:hypothetical protein B0O80DRAFT_425826 [Mortierella sp. GBAus27b]